MAGQPWLIRSEMQPAFDGGFIQSRFLIGGIFVVKNKAQRNAIHVLNRKLDASTTTLVVVSDENRIYRLINNPASIYTTDTDWETFFVGQTSSFRPVGSWDADNNVLVLSDAEALNRNGEFYFVADAPTQRTVQYAGLFEGLPVDVVNGDLVVSVGDKWTIITSTVQWDALSKPPVIDDYVDGIVIAHTHEMTDIVGLAAALDTKYDIDDTAPHDVDFSSVSDTAIVEVEFLRAFYYTAQEVDDLLTSFTGYTNEMAQDAVGSILTDTTSVNFTYNDPSNLITAAVITTRGLSIDSNGVGLGGTVGSDITLDANGTTGGWDFNLYFSTFTGGNSSNVNTGSNTFIWGMSNTNKASFGMGIFGEGNEADTGSGSGFIIGEGNYTDAYGAIAIGRGVKSSGPYSFAGGYYTVGGIGAGYYGKTNTKAPLVDGINSFGWFATDDTQIAGQGVLANQSVAIGGINPHIPATSPRSLVFGGSGIKARASDPDQVYLMNLNILGTPLNDNSLSRILVQDPTTGQIKYRDQATLGGGGGAGVTDGDKGDIVVSSSGAVWTIDSGITLDNQIYKLRTASSGLSTPSEGWMYYDTTQDDLRVYSNTEWVNATRAAYFTSAATNFTLTEAHRNAYIYFTASTEVTITLPITLAPGFAANLIMAGTGELSLTTPGTYEAIGDETNVKTRYTGVTVYLKPGNTWSALGALGDASGGGGNFWSLDGGSFTQDADLTIDGTDKNLSLDDFLTISLTTAGGDLLLTSDSNVSVTTYDFRVNTDNEVLMTADQGFTLDANVGGFYFNTVADSVFTGVGWRIIGGGVNPIELSTSIADITLDAGNTIQLTAANGIGLSSEYGLGIGSNSGGVAVSAFEDINFTSRTGDIIFRATNDDGDSEESGTYLKLRTSDGGNNRMELYAQSNITLTSGASILKFFTSAVDDGEVTNLDGTGLILGELDNGIFSSPYIGPGVLGMRAASAPPGYENFGLLYTDGDNLYFVDQSNVEIALGIPYFIVSAGQQDSGADLTNNVDVGGTDDEIDNWTSLAVYATDAAAIRNAIYQLTRKLKQINDGLRAQGLFS